MDEERMDTPQERLRQLGCPDPREVVEIYQGDGPREVVETFVSAQPLPGGKQTPKRRPEKRRVVARPKKRRHRLTGLWIALGCLFCLLVGVAVTLIVQDLAQPDQEENDYQASYETGSGEIHIDTYPTGDDVTLEIHTDHGKELMPQEIYEKVNPSVVTVIAQLDGGVSVGTGVIFTEDGYVLTNFHVVEDGTSCTVGLYTGKTYDAKYVAGDQENDIAILKVEPQSPLPAAEFGDSDALAVGDPVYAIGNPLRLELRGTFTDGIVSAINRNVTVNGKTMNLIQTNAALNNGNSGGPLINVYGQVVGINTIKMSSTDSNVEGLGFALPISSIAHMVNDLIACGEIQPEAMLGILQVQQLSDPLPDGNWGVRVYSVEPDTGAEEAGLRAGDVIVEANGEAVTSSADLQRIRRQFSAGEALPLLIWRDGAYLEIQVVLTVMSETE